MDPGIFVRRGVGVQAQLTEKNPDNFHFFYIVLKLFYSFTEGSNGLF